MNPAKAIIAKSANKREAARPHGALTTDLLILEDGTILAHNLTPALAKVLRKVSLCDLHLQLEKSAKRLAHRPSGNPSHELRD